MRAFIVTVTRNPISMAGSALTTACAVLLLTLLALELTGQHGNPYVGILAYLILPGVLVVGLALIPIGISRERRRRRHLAETGEAHRPFPVIDLNNDRTRRTVVVFLVLTLVNVVILSAASYKGVEVADSTWFCGQVCHSVMDPEHTTYLRSPHARVKCAECHIGPGANWFVKSKLSGAWQVVATTFDLYPRPIPTPVHNLRPARDTCEQCHWPDKFVGDRLKVITHYDTDEANTEMKTVLVLRVGGVQGSVAEGIHWHVDPGIQIRYRSDETREKISEVEMTLADGTVKTFRKDDGTAVEEGEEARAWRVMDCVDCHNRPTHIYRAAEDELDKAIYDGRLDRQLPFIRREGFRLLQEAYESHDEARRGITDNLTAFYDENYPELVDGLRPGLSQAAETLGEIYTTNVFPAMKITWGTYPNHIGHQHFEGCFRCHADEHATDDGETIEQDCDSCHMILAMEEEDPEILQQIQP